MDQQDLKQKCATDEELSAFLENDLDEARQAEISAHLAECTQCHDATEELRSITAGLAALNIEDLPNALFARIESAHREKAADTLGRRLSRWWERWWKMPAIAAAMGTAVVLLLVWPSVPTPGTPAPLTEMDKVKALDSVMAAQQTYATAIESLESSFHNEKAKYNPQTQKMLEQSLADINDAITRCRRMINQNPNDIDAHRTALAAYQQKVDLLTELIVDNPYE